MYVSEYRQRVEQRLLHLIDTHPAIEALAAGRDLSDDQLIALERTLRKELSAGDLELSEGNVLKAYGYKVGSLLEFLRRLLDLSGVPDYQDIIQRRFEWFITSQPFDADQIRFLRALQTVFQQRRQVHRADLYAPPLSTFGTDAVDRWFSDDERTAILQFTESLAVVA